MLYSNNIFLFSVIVFILLNRSYVTSLTRDEIKKSSRLIKKTCIHKNGVTEEEVGDIDKGKFIEERKVMCYVGCIYKMGQLLKGNKVNHDMMIKQVDMMFPTEMKTPVKKAIEHCKPVSKQYKDVCEASYWTAKCIHDFDPDNFIFA